MQQQFNCVVVAPDQSQRDWTSSDSVLMPGALVNHPSVHPSAGTVMTPNYLRSPKISVSPYCDCSNSGNNKDECDKFTEFFTENTCLRKSPPTPTPPPPPNQAAFWPAVWQIVFYYLLVHPPCAAAPLAALLFCQPSSSRGSSSSLFALLSPPPPCVIERRVMLFECVCASVSVSVLHVP